MTTTLNLARALRGQAGNERLAVYKRRDLLDAAGELERLHLLEQVEPLLASLAVHADELDFAVGGRALEADVAAIKAVAADPRVAAWLTTVDPALLPVKRS